MGGNFTQIYIVDCKLQRRRPNHGSCLDADEFVQTGSQEKKISQVQNKQDMRMRQKNFAPNMNLSLTGILKKLFLFLFLFLPVSHLCSIHSFSFSPSFPFS